MLLILINETPISLALKNQTFDIVASLIEHGSKREFNGQSIFEIGLEQHRLNIVKACTEKGEDINRLIKVYLFFIQLLLLVKHRFALHARKVYMILHLTS